jgi:hypothetical protein
MRLAIGLIVSGEVITRIYDSPSVAGPGTSPTRLKNTVNLAP